jgi:Excalibur calcium-binding domain
MKQSLLIPFVAILGLNGIAEAQSSRRPQSAEQPTRAPELMRGGAFRNCDAARAAGAAPVRRGEPGYGPHLDRDGDGVGCEPYRGRR